MAGPQKENEMELTCLPSVLSLTWKFINTHVHTHVSRVEQNQLAYICQEVPSFSWPWKQKWILPICWNESFGCSFMLLPVKRAFDRSVLVHKDMWDSCLKPRTSGKGKEAKAVLTPYLASLIVP